MPTWHVKGRPSPLPLLLPLPSLSHAKPFFFLIMKTKDYCISYCYKIGGRISELKSEVFMVIEFSKTLSMSQPCEMFEWQNELTYRETSLLLSSGK